MLNTKLFQYFRRKYWNKLEEMVRQEYDLIMIFAFPEYEEANLLAQILSEVIKRTKDQDLRISLMNDFGKFIILQLDHRECVECIGEGTGECIVCLEELTERMGYVYHRTCENFIGHVQCFDTWYKNTLTPPLTCPHCNVVLHLQETVLRANT